MCGTPGAASRTLVVDPKPDGLAFVGSPVATRPEWTCGLDLAGNASCANPVFIPPGYTVTFLLDATVTAAGGTVINCAEASNAQDATVANNRACVSSELVSRGCDLRIVKAMSPSPVIRKQAATVTITVTNVGGQLCPAGSVIRDDEPPGLSFVSSHPRAPGWGCSVDRRTVRCQTRAAMAPGVGTTLTFDAAVFDGPGRTVTNCAEANNPADFNLANNQSCATIDIVSPVCDLQLDKTMSTPLLRGEPVSVTITVTNVATVPCDPGGAGTVVEDLGWKGLTFTATPTADRPGWTCSLSRPVGCSTTAALPAGDTVTFSIAGLITAGEGTRINNCAKVSNPNDLFVGNNSDCAEALVVTPCDLSVIKAMPDTLLSGEQADITITVANVGGGLCPPGSGGTTVTDTQPPGLTFLGQAAADQPGWLCSLAAGVAACTTMATLPAGHTVTFVIPATVTAPDKATVLNCARIANRADRNGSNDRSCDQSTVQLLSVNCDLAIDKAMSPQPLVQDQPATITITVANIGQGSCAARGTRMEDRRPAGLYISWRRTTMDGWICSLDRSTLECWPRGNMPPASSVTLTFDATVLAKAGSSVTNCATVSNRDDLNSSNNESCTTLPVIPPFTSQAAAGPVTPSTAVPVVAPTAARPAPASAPANDVVSDEPVTFPAALKQAPAGALAWPTSGSPAQLGTGADEASGVVAGQQGGVDPSQLGAQAAQLAGRGGGNPPTHGVGALVDETGQVEGDQAAQRPGDQSAPAQAGAEAEGLGELDDVDDQAVGVVGEQTGQPAPGRVEDGPRSRRWPRCKCRGAQMN